jgi:hypothetical protein
VLSYYEILGVKPTASESEIKKAYRTISKTFHPDKADGVQNEALMREATKARDTLTDPHRRRIYDQDLSGGGSDTYSDTSSYDYTRSTNYTYDESQPTGSKYEAPAAPPRLVKKRSGWLLLICVLSYYFVMSNTLAFATVLFQFTGLVALVCFIFMPKATVERHVKKLGATIAKKHAVKKSTKADGEV